MEVHREFERNGVRYQLSVYISEPPVHQKWDPQDYWGFSIKRWEGNGFWYFKHEHPEGKRYEHPQELRERERKQSIELATPELIYEAHLELWEKMKPEMKK